MDKEDMLYTHTHTQNGITLLCSIYIYTYNGILFSHKKEGNLAICNKELEGYYVRDISHIEKDKYCVFSLTYGLYKAKQTN